MDKPKIIKSIVPYVCPHCGHDIMVCFGFLPPALSWVITGEEMLANKEKLKALMENIEFSSEEDKKETLDWIASEDCVLGVEDIDDVVKMISQEQKEKK